MPSRGNDAMRGHVDLSRQSKEEFRTNNDEVTREAIIRILRFSFCILRSTLEIDLIPTGSTQ
jgi:hypothetical protein